MPFPAKGPPCGLGGKTLLTAIECSGQKNWHLTIGFPGGPWERIWMLLAVETQTSKAVTDGLGWGVADEVTFPREKFPKVRSFAW